MSTGITYPIEERAMGLREYLERCWALCSREHQADAPLPATIAEDSYHAERLSDAQREFDSAQKMTLEESAAELAIARERGEASRLEHGKRKAILRQRYDDLIDGIESWNAPAVASGYKEMALRHARESRDFDCPAEMSGVQTPITAEEWLADKRDMARGSLDRAIADLARHRENVKQANAVLDAIRAVPR